MPTNKVNKTIEWKGDAWDLYHAVDFYRKGYWKEGFAAEWLGISIDDFRLFIRSTKTIGDNTMEQTNSAVDSQRWHRDQLILSATYKAFGSIPVDEKYLPIMSAFMRCAIAEALDKKLMDLLGDVVSDGPNAVVEASNNNRTELNNALREYDQLTTTN